MALENTGNNSMKPYWRKKSIIVAVFILFAGILACENIPTPLQTSATPPPPTVISSPTFTPIPVYSVLTLVSKMTEETGKAPDFTIKAETPFFQGSEDLRVTNFNNEMALLTQEEISKFRDNLLQIQALPGAAGSYFDQQYQLLSPTGNLVSIKFQITNYMHWAAHPGTHTRTVTYNLEAGTDVQLSQLFLPGSDYLAMIANFCVGELKKRNIDFDSFSAGAEPLPENYGNWNITSDGLLITFDEYQVAAYAAGPQEVVVPFAELQSVIDPRGILKGFLP